jgi:hypothetical protein
MVVQSRRTHVRFPDDKLYRKWLVSKVSFSQRMALQTVAELIDLIAATEGPQQVPEEKYIFTTPTTFCWASS